MREGGFQNPAYSAPSSAARLRRELELEEARLAQLRNVESGRRLRESELGVQGAQDQIEDARDELEQLEKLYKGNELADATKEIVLKRGHRSLQRAAESLALKEIAHKTLKEDLLPAELGKLQLEADRKRDECERSARNAETLLQQKKAALLRAQIELQKAKDALGELEKAEKK